MRKGIATIQTYWNMLQADTGRLLGLEIPFLLPIEIDGRWHEVEGTMDRLSLRKGSRPYLNIEDYKSGKEQRYLRHNVQFSVYCWATTQPAFWAQWGDEAEDLYARVRLLPRRGTWINVQGGAKRKDAGYRGEQDYARLKVALREYIRTVEADIYPLSLSGEHCTWCPFADGICGGVPIPDDSHGSEKSA